VYFIRLSKEVVVGELPLFIKLDITLRQLEQLL
jgi:hypothetical protein